MERVLLVGVAGLVGTLARFGLSGWADQKWGSTFPVGTLLVNLTGCLVAGFLFNTLQDKYLVDPVVRTSVLVGLLGGFTTFSSFGLQTFTLFRDGKVFLGVTDIVLSNVAGLACVWAGYSLSRAL